MSAIVMFGVMALGEFSGWAWLKHTPLNLSTKNSLWNNEVYMFGAFFAFTATVILTQYLTRTVVARMTSKEIEAAHNRDLLEAIITAMGEGLLFVNNEGKVTISNPEADKWIGNKKELLNNFPAPLAKHVRELMARQGGAAHSCTSIKFDIKEPYNGYVEAKSCPVVGDDGAKLGYVIVGQDMTEHKKLERDLRMRTEETSQINEMLKMSRVEMAQREKMVAIGQMATGIAHEIGNPLASLSSLLQYIGRKIKDEKQIEQFDLMGKQIDRISVILRRMLSLSRPATSEYKWIDINNTIENTLALVQFDKRAQSVTIENTANSQLPMIWLNPLHFEQVLLNVVINALDAMTARETRDQHVLKVTRTFEDGMIEVRISDTGIGMDQAICKRAFESFFTTKELGKGTGLGLFISYNLITEIDGTIAMDSEPGKGTTVIIRIPVRPKEHLIGDSEDVSNVAAAE
jgi:signal transduction histidine kinase